MLTLALKSRKLLVLISRAFYFRVFPIISEPGTGQMYQYAILLN